MSLFYKQNAAARFFVDQTNGKVKSGGCWAWLGCDIMRYDTD